MENLRITETIKENLLTAVKWLKFLTVMGIIGMVLLLLLAFVIPFIVPQGGLAMSFFYLIAFAIYIYPISKCLNIVKSTREAMNGSQVDLETAAASLKSVLKYMGILCIIALSLYALILLFVILFSAAGLLSFM